MVSPRTRETPVTYAPRQIITYREGIYTVRQWMGSATRVEVETAIVALMARGIEAHTISVVVL